MARSAGWWVMAVAATAFAMVALAVARPQASGRSAEEDPVSRALVGSPGQSGSALPSPT